MGQAIRSGPDEPCGPKTKGPVGLYAVVVTVTEPDTIKGSSPCRCV